MNDLEALLRSLRYLDDEAACRTLADHLEEDGHPLAAEVRLLADARLVVPREWPSYWRPAGDGYGFVRSHDGNGLGVHPDHYTLACGRWWDIILMPRQVTWRAFGTPEGVRIISSSANRGVEVVPVDPHELVGPDEEDHLRRAAEVCRRQIIGELFERFLTCRSLWRPLDQMTIIGVVPCN
jgi:hypothetical protein